MMTAATTMAPAPSSKKMVSILTILTKTTTKDTKMAPDPTAKTINKIGDHETTATVTDATTGSEKFVNKKY